MAYYRTYPNGKTHLVYTARDRRIQEERREVWFSANGYPLEHRRDSFTTKERDWFWRWHDFDLAKMEAALHQQEEHIRDYRARMQVTRLRENRRIDNVTAWLTGVVIDGKKYTASPGYLSGMIPQLNRMIYDLKRTQAFVAAFKRGRTA